MDKYDWYVRIAMAGCALSTIAAVVIVVLALIN